MRYYISFTDQAHLIINPYFMHSLNNRNSIALPIRHS